MGESYLKTFLEFLKLIPTYLVPLGLAAAFLVFGPEQWLQYLGVHDFAQRRREELSLLMIFAAVSFGIERSKKIMGGMRNRMLGGKRKQRILERLHSLTEDEKQILRFYIAKQTRTNYLNIGDGVVQGLIAAGIIWRSPTLGNPFEFAHNITEFAWNYLNENPGLLDGTTDTLRTDKRERERW